MTRGQLLSEGGEMDYVVIIRGQIEADDDFRRLLGDCDASDPWQRLPLPRCPDCGGELLYAEVSGSTVAYYCLDCRSRFGVRVIHGQAWMERLRLFVGSD